MNFEKIQPILELYSCIQTEGSKAGIPHILIRTTGCTHRCYFGENNWCDSWYTSIHPEKGKFSLNSIYQIIDDNPHINHFMITGGSPTMHPDLINTIVNLITNHHLSELRKPFITLETEGSHFLKTDHPIDLISLSPKFSNSVPVLNTVTPQGDIVDEKFIKQHNKYRLKVDTIKDLLEHHLDYHFKPVVSKDKPEIWSEIEDFITHLNIPKNKVWAMPAGGNRESLIPNYSYVIEECIKRGYNFSGRAHVIAYNDKRGV